MFVKKLTAHHFAHKSERLAPKVRNAHSVGLRRNTPIKHRLFCKMAAHFLLTASEGAQIDLRRLFWVSSLVEILKMHSTGHAIHAEAILFSLVFALYIILGLGGVSITAATVWALLFSISLLAIILRTASKPVILTRRYDGIARTLLHLLATIIGVLFCAFMYGYLFQAFPYKTSAIPMFIVSTAVMSASLIKTILIAASLHYQSRIVGNTPP